MGALDETVRMQLAKRGLPMTAENMQGMARILEQGGVTSDSVPIDRTRNRAIDDAYYWSAMGEGGKPALDESTHMAAPVEHVDTVPDGNDSEGGDDWLADQVSQNRAQREAVKPTKAHPNQAGDDVPPPLKKAADKMMPTGNAGETVDSKGAYSYDPSQDPNAAQPAPGGADAVVSNDEANLNMLEALGLGGLATMIGVPIAKKGMAARQARQGGNMPQKPLALPAPNASNRPPQSEGQPKAGARYAEEQGYKAQAETKQAQAAADAEAATRQRYVDGQAKREANLKARQAATKAAARAKRVSRGVR